MKRFLLGFLILGMSLNATSQIIQQTVDINSGLTASNLTALSTAFQFSRTRPVCVVLIHGITGNPVMCSTAIANREAPDRPINTLRFARHYWSYEFVNGLFNLTTDKIYTFSDGTLAGELNATPATWETKLTRDLVATDHILTGCGIPPSTGPTSTSGCQGFYTVMMTHRDGSLPLKQQIANTANQIRSFYNSVFGGWAADKQPQLILLCHSGGGLVARGICSNPTSMGFSNDQYVPVSMFSDAEKANMNFVRQRTMYMVTLATPHEGALIATLGASAQGTLAGLSSFSGLSFPFDANVSAIDGKPTSPILRELDPEKMLIYNQNQLKPENCKRPDGSLIPIYAMGGRASGGPFFYSDPNRWDADISTPDGGITLKRDQIKFEGFTNAKLPINNRKEFEAAGLISAEFAVNMTYLPLINLPTTNPAVKRLLAVPANNPQLDIVSLQNITLNKCVDKIFFNPLDLPVGVRMFCLRQPWNPTSVTLGICSGAFSRDTRQTTISDGIVDSDGFVNIVSSLGVGIGTGTDNYFSNTSGGSWYRRYRSAADYDHHGSITQRPEVSAFLRTDIIGVTAATNLINTGIPSTSAGPKPSTSGTKSIW